LYQAVYFNREPGEAQWEYYIRDDKKGISHFPYWNPVYKLDEEGEHTTLFGDRCTEIKGKYDKKDPTIIEKDISKELVFLRDFYYKTDEIPSYHNLVYLDIEIEIIGSLNSYTIQAANAEITSIALIDDNTKQKTCFILDKEQELGTIEQNNVSIVSCKTEVELIKLFLSKWEQLDPTIVCGYNSDFFDIPYLYYRIQKLLGDEVLRLSPVGKISVNVYNPDKPITIGLVNSLDFLLLLKKYISKEELSYKLGDIGQKYVQLGKIEYDGSLDVLFRDNKEKFIEYNIRDVEILEALEEKLKFIELTILISHICHTPYESIHYNTVLNEGAILTYLKRKGIVAPNKPTTTNSLIKDLFEGDHVVHQRGTPTIEGYIHEINKEQITIKTLAGKYLIRNIKTVKKKDGYAGGYLLDPVPGLYFNVIDLDFKSLYPSLIKTINIGIETLVGNIVTKNNYEQNHSLEKLKLLPKEQNIEIQKLNKHTYTTMSTTVKVGALIEMIEKNKWSVSASGAFFRTDIKSISCEVLEDWFDKRNYYKGLMKKAGKSEDWDNYKLYDLYQMAFKILQNALYGTYAVNSWRFTDGFKICSAAITNSGQRLTQGAITFTDNYIAKQINKPDTKYIRGSDTDSMYVEATELLKYKYPEFEALIKQDKIQKILEIAETIQKSANENLNNISSDLFNVHGKHYFELEQEVVAESVYWSGKRRYAMYIVNKGGVEIEEMDFKGLDLMKSNFPKYFKDFGEQVIKDILFQKPQSSIDKNVQDFKQSISKTDWKLLLKPTGIKKLEEYIELPPTKGRIFSTLKSRTPINTRAASYTNDLLRFKKLNIKYPEFRVGDKMYYAYLKPNAYNINVIGFNGYNDPPEIIELVEKYIDKELLFDSVLKNKLENLYSDIGWKFPSLNPNVNKFFTFV
jgi:DNA polymerase elongation subunit (family B)